MSRHHPHILVITDFFFPDSHGGANKMAHHTAKGLAEHGFDLTVLTRQIDHSHAGEQHLDGMHVFRYRLNNHNPFYFLMHTRRRLAALVHRIARRKQGHFDLLIIHQPLVAAVLKRHPAIGRAPWLYNFHSPWAEEFNIKYSSDKRPSDRLPLHLIAGAMVRKSVEGNVLRRSGKIVVLSRFMRNRVHRLHGLGRKTVVIPGGVDTGEFRPTDDGRALRRQMGLPPDKIVLFTVRNLRQRMGLENLVQAMAGMNGLQENLHLVIAGRGELESRLRRIARRLDVSRYISFPGSLSEDDLKKFYRAAHLFVLPTEKLEGFGMVTLEALSSGLPVIATPVGATPEILSAVGDDWMCADSSAAALAAKIAERVSWMIDHPQDYAALQDRCRQLACRAYDWSIITAQWARLCHEAMGA